MKSTTAEILLSRNFLLGFLSFFFLWISFDLFILFPLFILQSGGNSVDVGIQTAIFYIPSVLMRPMAGWFTDRIGRLKVLWFGSVLMIVSALLLCIPDGQYEEIKWWIASILFVRGIGFAAFFTAFFTYVVDLSLPENRARILGLFGVSGLVAGGIAPKVGEWILGSFTFKGFFLFSASLSFLSLIISAFLKEQERILISRDEGFRIIKKVTVTRTNWMTLPGAFVFGYLMASYNTFGAPYFQEAGKGSVGYFFLTYGLVAGGIRVLFGGIADRYERWKLITVFFLVYAAGVALLVVPPVEKFYLLAAAISGGAHGILFPSMTAMAVDAHPPEYRGMITSVFTAVLELGFSLGSYLLGVIVAYKGYRFMFLSASTLVLLFSIYILVVRWMAKTGTLRNPI